jgi:benzoylformate decarboxylase
MAGQTQRFAILEQLLADGMTYMFGNPGTVEQGFLDALMDYPNLKYIETLQESIAVGIADGYARATKRPTLVQLHSGVGLGNGIGMIYQAMRGHAPLVVINGDAGVRYDAMDAQMAADLVGMARPVTKWATKVVDPSSTLRVLRRAIKLAGTPPMGPVFVSLPMDILDAPRQEAVVPTAFPSTRVAPEASLIREAAELLAGAVRPLIIIGDGIAASGAQQELAQVAELCGAEVWGAEDAEVNIAGGVTNPHYRGSLGHMFGEQSRAIVTHADVVLICGTYVFPEVFPSLDNAFALGAKVIHVDLNAYEIGKNHPVDLGVVADPKTTLAQLEPALKHALNAEQRRAAAQRTATLADQKEQQLSIQKAADQTVRDAVPLQVSRFMADLAGHLPADTVIFDEALTSSPELTRYLPPTLPGHFFQTRGGSLGVGIPGAIGAKLANPDKTVVGFTGDGGGMYTIQALWTAARHNIGAKFVVCNNRSYRLLKLNVQHYWRERQLAERDFPACFDISEPNIRFDQLAHSVGVPGARVEKPGQIEPAIAKMLAHDGPFLLDLVITGEVPDHWVYTKCGQ